jgi:thiamine-phosphate pyrophosphorylase
VNQPLPRLMLVTDRRRVPRGDLVRAVAEAARGGVACIQVREKDLPDDAYVELVRRIRDRVPADTNVIVNGRARIARVLGLALHLPAGSPLPSPRSAYSAIGRSAHSAAEVRAAVEERADWLVAGAVYPTESKPGQPGAGLEVLRERVGGAGRIPVFAIGGVTISRVPEVLRAGAYGVAVCGAILGAPDPQRVAEGFLLALVVAGAGARVHD